MRCSADTVLTSTPSNNNGPIEITEIEIVLKIFLKLSSQNVYFALECFVPIDDKPVENIYKLECL